MIDEQALKAANDRQTERAFSITNALYDLGYPSAVSGGCARRFMGWCEFANDADMLTNAPTQVVELVFKDHGLSIIASHEHMVGGYDENGLYEACCLKTQGADASIFSKDSLNWSFEHRALCLDARTKLPIEQPSGVKDLKEVRARVQPARLFFADPYMCYIGLAHACREDIPFDEGLMELMRQRPNLNFFMGLFFKIISKTLLGRAPSRGMDRLLEANAFGRLPAIQEAWRSAGRDLRQAIDGSSHWIEPWIMLARAYPAIRQDMLQLYFPEQWLTYYERHQPPFFPLLDVGERQRPAWTYWQTRRMMMELAAPPACVLESPRITERPTPWPFP